MAGRYETQVVRCPILSEKTPGDAVLRICYSVDNSAPKVTGILCRDYKNQQCMTAVMCIYSRQFDTVV